MPDRTRVHPPSNPDSHRRQSRTARPIESSRIEFTSVSVGDLPYNNTADIISPISASISSRVPSPVHSTAALVPGDMKISPHDSIFSKRTSPTTFKDSALNIKDLATLSSLSDTINNNTDTMNNNMSSKQQQGKQQQRQQGLAASDRDANNNKNVSDAKTPSNSSDLCPNLNENTNNTNQLVWNNNDKEMSDAEFSLWSKRRLQRIDSGFYSSASDEDATDRNSTCQCSSATKPSKSTWPRRLHRSQPRKLSITRSQSWSSLDSDAGGSTSISNDQRPYVYSPSASSLSSLSSLWSLASSSRNNLSCTPSLDSLIFSSSFSSGITLAGDAEPGVCVVPSPPAEMPECESHREANECTNVSRAEEKPTEISTVPLPTHSDKEAEGERNDEDVALLTDNIPATRNSSGTTAEGTSTAVRPPELALAHAQPVAARLARIGGRRHRNRDHNNNAGVQRGMVPHEFLPRSPGRLGDCFSKKGIVTFLALIVYTLSLMVVFAVLGSATRGLKAAVGKQDLKEMRKSLTRSRRSRRTPATSG